MKKFLFFFVLTLSLSQLSYGQSLDNLMKSLSSTQNIEKVQIGRFMMELGKAFGGVGNMPVARGVHSMVVYDLSTCDVNFKKEFAEQINRIKDDGGYETLIMAKDKGDGVRIMMKKKKGIISDMVFLCMDDKDPAVIKISGKIKEEDIAELIEKYDK